MWPYAIVGSFLVLAAFDAYIVKRALETRTGVTEARPYEAGLRHEEIVAARREAHAARLKAEFIRNSDGLALKVDGLPPDQGQELTLTLMRPNDPSLDRRLSSQSSNGSFTLVTEPLQAGLWIATIDIRAAGKRYLIEQKEMF